MFIYLRGGTTLHSLCACAIPVQASDAVSECGIDVDQVEGNQDNANRRAIATNRRNRKQAEEPTEDDPAEEDTTDEDDSEDTTGDSDSSLDQGVEGGTIIPFGLVDDLFELTGALEYGNDHDNIMYTIMRLSSYYNYASTCTSTWVVSRTDVFGPGVGGRTFFRSYPFKKYEGLRGHVLSFRTYIGTCMKAEFPLCIYTIMPPIKVAIILLLLLQCVTIIYSNVYT